jgi:hypothetical protein
MGRVFAHPYRPAVRRALALGRRLESPRHSTLAKTHRIVVNAARSIVDLGVLLPR